MFPLVLSNILLYSGLMSAPLPCDYDLVNLRSWSPRAGATSALLVLRRLAPDCSWASLTAPDCLEPSSVPTLQFYNLTATFEPTSLTANHKVQPRPNLFHLSPMEISSFNVTFT